MTTIKHYNGTSPSPSGSLLLRLFQTIDCFERWFVVGGDKSDLRIYDVNNAATPIFKARNVKPDKLQLEQPKCINDVAFVPGSDGTRIVTGTKYEYRILTCSS